MFLCRISDLFVQRQQAVLAARVKRSLTQALKRKRQEENIQNNEFLFYYFVYWDSLKEDPTVKTTGNVKKKIPIFSVTLKCVKLINR